MLSGKTAIITGARQGIGEAVALAFARAGADLMLVSRRIKEDDAVVAGCREA
ncbi:MAG: SDR family NAD(P)-dependent oxidoreductase, partial [Bacillota bacterium]